MLGTGNHTIFVSLRTGDDGVNDITCSISVVAIFFEIIQMIRRFIWYDKIGRVRVPDIKNIYIFQPNTYKVTGFNNRKDPLTVPL